LPGLGTLKFAPKADIAFFGLDTSWNGHANGIDADGHPTPRASQLREDRIISWRRFVMTERRSSPGAKGQRTEGALSPSRSNPRLEMLENVADPARAFAQMKRRKRRSRAGQNLQRRTKRLVAGDETICINPWGLSKPTASLPGGLKRSNDVAQERDPWTPCCRRTACQKPAPGRPTHKINGLDEVYAIGR